jgi:hypothetical protein
VTAAKIPNEWCTGLKERKSLQPTLWFWVHPSVIFELLMDLFIKSQCMMEKVFIAMAKTSSKGDGLNSLQEGFSCKSVTIQRGAAYARRDGRQMDPL